MPTTVRSVSRDYPVEEGAVQEDTEKVTGSVMSRVIACNAHDMHYTTVSSTVMPWL